MEESPAGGDGDFLAALPVGAAEELRRLGARRRFPAGAALFFEGDPAHEALVLLSGAVKVSVGSADGKEIVLEVFEAGALLGELSVLDGKPRSATVTTLVPVEVLTVAAGSFNEFLDRNPRVLRRLLIDVIGRLRSRVRPAGVRCGRRAGPGLRPPRRPGRPLRRTGRTPSPCTRRSTRRSWPPGPVSHAKPW